MLLHEDVQQNKFFEEKWSREPEKVGTLGQALSIR
jgi:hypothetical protein